MLPQLNRFAPAAPTDAEVSVAKESSRRLGERAHAKGLRLATDGTGGDIPLPPVAARLVRELLAALAEGQAVVVLPLHAELTTQEAADLMGVSRPHFVGLLDAGRLPHRKVGRHRRVRAEDVLAFQRAEHAARQRTLDQLAADAQELDMGY